jgi:STE24 endopeptidase
MTITLLLCYLLTVAAGYWLSALNIRHLRRYGNIVPAGFEGAIDPETLARTSAYTLEKNQLGLVESILDNLLLVLFLFGGLLGVYDRWIASLSSSFVVSGVLFFLILTLAQTILGIPVSLYDTFRIENRYEFNNTTPRLWLADLVKSTAVSIILLALVAMGGFAIIRFSPGFWWLWVWGFFAAVSIFVMYLSPYVIEPLFNKFEPVKEDGLEDEIRTLLAKTGLKVSRVMQMDASRRSRHSNAYFTGIGRVKRIVLYDTLLKQMTHGEVLAVLAHEVGHWKKGHIWKRLVMTELLGLASCYLAYRLTAWGGLPGLLGVPHVSFAAQLVILAFIGAIATFPFAPLLSWLSRRQEREADRFAADLTGEPAALASSLIKLSRENLSNVHPHPLYAQFYYSHPPVVERVRQLMGETKTPEGRSESQSEPEMGL